MRYLMLALTLVISTESWAAHECSSFLKSQQEISPIARISFLAKSKKKMAVTFSRDKTMLDAAFTKSFLVGLTSYFAGKSTTTSRLEERAVMKESDSVKLLEESGLNWKPRDEKQAGEDFTTVTTYSGKFIMDSGGDVEVSAKMRARKYYGHLVGETQTSKMTSIFGDVGTLELKISNVAGVTAEGFTAFPNSVFKPRIFISDDGLLKLSKLSHKDLMKAETRESLISELHNIETARGRLNSNRDQVEAFIHAVALLLEKNPNLFEVQTVVAYNRDSFAATSETGAEYEYTLDRGIRIYEPDAKLSASDIISYLDRKPLHQVEKGVAFAELKSPMIEKTTNTDTYQQLSYALFSKHRTRFTKGKGKHSLGSKIRSTLAQTTLSEQLHTEGLLYYLIKGTGNLPTPPNRKRLVEMGELRVGLPLKIDGEDHRLIVGYRPHIVDGKRSEVIASIGLIDSLGRKVSLNHDTTKEIIAKTLESTEPSTITIDNQALTFPAVVDPATVSKFNDFFDRFYTNHSKGQANPREIESLNAIGNSSQLSAYTKRMNLSNTLSFLKDRAFKVAATAALVGAITLGPNVMDYVNSSSQPHTLESVFTSKSNENVNIRFLTEQESIEIRGRLMGGSKIEVSPALPKDPSEQNLTLDIKAIKDVGLGEEGSTVPAIILLNQ